MRAARFVTLCFVYCGLPFLGQYLLVYRYSVGVRGVVHLVVALSVVATGLLRLSKRDVEPRIRRPTDRQYTRSGRFRWFSP